LDRGGCLTPKEVGLYMDKIPLLTQNGKWEGLMMELDTKQKVLLALYAEYQKDLPNMREIRADTLGLTKDVFYVAIEKLQNEGFIRDANIAYAGMGPYPFDVKIDRCKLTRYGMSPPGYN
jgi:hypothetical protein